MDWVVSKSTTDKNEQKVLVERSKIQRGKEEVRNEPY